MPPSVMTPSTSNPTSRMRFASLGSSTDHLTRALPYVQRDLENPGQIVQRDHVRPVTWGAIGIRVGFQEEPVGAGGGGRVEQRRDVLPPAAAGARLAPARLLHRVRSVEHH